MNEQKYKKKEMKRAIEQLRLIGNDSPRAILAFEELKEHFKVDGWDLDYFCQLEISTLPPKLFNMALKMKGYKVKLTKYGKLVICLQK
jgi:hypothetical protein